MLLNDKFGNISDPGRNRIQKGGRFDYLDNIKWVLAVLVIWHHAAAIAGLDKFLINLPLVTESQRFQYGILSAFQSVNQGYFMSLFFFISAYFVAPSFNRKGGTKFLKDKFIRLGIPVILTIIVIDPIGFYISGDLPFLVSMENVIADYMSMLKSLNLIMGVTWFCWTLIVFNIIYVLFRMSGVSSGGSKEKSVPLPSVSKMMVFAILMIPLDYLGFYLMKVLGENFLGFHLLKYFPMYIAMFYFGIQAQKNNWIDQLTFRHFFLWLVIWIMARIFLISFSQMISRPFEVIGMSIIVIYSFKSLYNFQNAWTRVLSRSAYAAYVIQVIPLCFVGKIILPYMTQYPVLNFLIIGIPSVIVIFFLAHLICKVPLLSKVF